MKPKTVVKKKSHVRQKSTNDPKPQYYNDLIKIPNKKSSPVKAQKRVFSPVSNYQTQKIKLEINEPERTERFIDNIKFIESHVKLDQDIDEIGREILDNLL